MVARHNTTTRVALALQVVHQASDGWAPVYADAEQRLAVMSIGFLVASPDDPIIWRGQWKIQTNPLSNQDSARGH